MTPARIFSGIANQASIPPFAHSRKTEHSSNSSKNSLQDPPLYKVDLESFHRQIYQSGIPKSTMPDPPWWQKSFVLFTPLGLAGCQEPEAPDQPPMIGDIENVWVEEGEIAKFFFRVPDPEGDAVRVTMQPHGTWTFPGNAKLVQRLGDEYEIFWKTRTGDVGEYHIEILAQSGEFTVSEPVIIYVREPRSDVDAGLPAEEDASAGLGIDAGIDAGTDAPDAGVPEPDAGVPEPHHCDLPPVNDGDGTAISPFEFGVLVYVEQETKALAEGLGWDISTGVANQIAYLNACFNDGALDHTYNFSLIGIQYPTLDIDAPDYKPNINETPEDEDLLILYDYRYPSNSYGGNVITIGTNVPNLAPGTDNASLLCHEAGHFRGSFDTYFIRLTGMENEVFPGADYYFPPYGKWDPVSTEIMNAAEGDPKKGGLHVSMD